MYGYKELLMTTLLKLRNSIWQRTIPDDWAHDLISSSFIVVIYIIARFYVIHRCHLATEFTTDFFRT
jgi:hypothetical protein